MLKATLAKRAIEKTIIVVSIIKEWYLFFNEVYLCSNIFSRRHERFKLDYTGSMHLDLNASSRHMVCTFPSTRTGIGPRSREGGLLDIRRTILRRKAQYEEITTLVSDRDFVSSSCNKPTQDHGTGSCVDLVNNRNMAGVRTTPLI